MREVSYMKQLNPNSILMVCDELPDKGFIDAIKVRDICSAKLYTRGEKKNRQPGEPDVLLKSVTGGNKNITRQELTTNYVHCTGKKIALSHLKNGKSYIVFRECNENYKVLLIPNNCKGQLRGKGIGAGTYLVCKADENGNPIKNTMYPLSEKQFRKCFKIPMQSIIKRHMNGERNKVFGLFSVNGNRPQRMVQPDINSSFVGGTPNLTKKPMISKQQAPIQRQQAPIQQKQAPVQQKQAPVSKYRFKAVNRLININTKKPVGFVILEIATGKTKQFSLQAVQKMCEEKSVENIMIVNNNGVKFLKGNGIRLENLPDMIVN